MVRAEFDRQGVKDWEAFLSLRAQELCPGGRLVIVLPALADDGSSGFTHVIDEANTALEDMVSDGAITAEERSRMAVGNYPRRKRDLLAPFEANGEFHHLTVEDCVMSELPDAAWTDYQRDGNKDALVTKHALFFRSILVPSLASALVRVRAGDAQPFSPLEINWSSVSGNVWRVSRQRPTHSSKALCSPRQNMIKRKYLTCTP